MVALIKERVPWWAKIYAKIVLSRLPLNYRLWQRTGIFQHGFMLDPALFANSGFYTNRLRPSQFRDIFVRAGFMIQREEFDRWPALPLERRYLHPDYARPSDEDLSVRGMDLLAHKPS